MNTFKNRFFLLLSLVAVVFASCSRTPQAFFEQANDMQLVESGPKVENTDQLAMAQAIEAKEATVLENNDNNLLVIEPATIAYDDSKLNDSNKKTKTKKFAKNKRNRGTKNSVAKSKKGWFKGSLMASAANKMYDAVDAKRKENGKYANMSTADIFAIVSLSAGVLAIITFYGVFLFGIAGIVFGILALNRGTSRRGMAIAGIILGAFAFLFWILLFFLVFGFFGAASVI